MATPSIEDFFVEKLREAYVRGALWMRDQTELRLHDKPPTAHIVQPEIWQCKKASEAEYHLRSCSPP